MKPDTREPTPPCTPTSALSTPKSPSHTSSPPLTSPSPVPSHLQLSLSPLSTAPPSPIATPPSPVIVKLVKKRKWQAEKLQEKLRAEEKVARPKCKTPEELKKELEKRRKAEEKLYGEKKWGP